MIVKPFRFFCQKVLPLVYDDSLSYYELLCKVVDYINKLIDSDVEISQALADLRTDFENYVNSTTEIIEEIVDQIVEEYFNEHPEVVIPDNGVTFEKLNAELKERFFDAGGVRYYFPFLTDESGSGYSGTCFLAVTSQGKTAMFDAGPTSDWSAIKDYFDNLYSEGIFTNIDYIFISHYHGDHVQNLANIISTYPHENAVAYIPPEAKNFREDRKGVIHTWATDCEAYYDSVTETLTDANIPYTEVKTNLSITVDPDFIVSCYNTRPEDYSHYDAPELNSPYNNYSMVFVFKVRNSWSCYPGDIQRLAQEHLYSLYDFPRLAVYVVHHHGIQNDDFVPFLNMINPEISVVSTSHNRAMVTGASSFAANWFSGLITSTAYSAIEVTQGTDGAIVTEGTNLFRVGWEYADVDIYVDNSYTGAVHNGTMAYPYTDINEALASINKNGHFRYYIYVKGTATIYPLVWAHDITAPVIFRIWDSAPSVAGIYIRDSADISVSGYSFNGTGRAAYSRQILALVENSHAVLQNCSFDGSAMTSTSVHTGVTVSGCILYMSGCSFANLAIGADAYRTGGIHAVGNSFDTVSVAAYETRHLDLYLEQADTLTDTTLWIQATADTVHPVHFAKEVLTAANIALLDPDVVSVPFYRSASHPCVIVCGPHLYDITKSEVTLS